MAYLYVNQKGQEWRKHSYSAGTTFDQSPLKYYLQKVEGWREIVSKACFPFGRAVEDAIQWHHEHDGEGAVNHFIKEWQKHADNRDLKYTKVEKDWPTMYQMGVQMVKLYVIRQPNLPIPMGGQTLFQVDVAKEVFPGSPDFGGIEDVGRLDIVSYVDPKHPLLTTVNWKPEYGPLRPLIVDIKTASKDFQSQYGMASHDIQLRRYSWHTGIRDVAFLWFVKKALALQKGYTVTLLEDAGVFKAGSEKIIAAMEDGNPILLDNDSMVEEMERVQGFKEDGKLMQTNVAKERRDVWLKQFGVQVKPEQVTKQRLQFNAGFVTVDSANDAGDVAGDQIIRIVNCRIRGRWPDTFGIRFPNDGSSDPYFRAFVLKDNMFKDQNFRKVSDEDDLFAESDDNE
jgi:hypothetical protein